MNNKPVVFVRFDSKAQVERLKRAAKVRKWSVNRFVVEATEEAVNLLTTVKPSEQATDDLQRETAS